MSKPLAFAKTSPEPLRFDKKLGMCFGWSCFAKKDGEAYEDSHGDHIPEDDILLAALELSALPVEDRTIKANHSGGARGSIVSCWGMTEDIAKACDVDTHGTAGILVAFKPDEELLKSIESGEAFCLSIGGVSHDPEVIEKSAAAKVEKRKRILRKVSIHEISVVKLGAHEGAKVALIKRADVEAEFDKSLAGAKKWLAKAIARHERHMDGTEATDAKSQQKMMDEMKKALEELDADSSMSMDKHVARMVADVAAIAKSSEVAFAARTPAATSLELGHQHLIYDADEKDGSTSYERADGYQYGHSHGWIKGADGTITVLAADGHTHTLATETIAMSNPTDIAKAQADTTALKADFAKAKETFAKALATLVALPPDQAAFAKRLKGDELEQFLGKPEADRAALAKPIHKSERTGRCFYAGEEQLAEMQKDSDALAEKLAKSERAAEAATFEKRAAVEIPNLRGTPEQKGAILKAVEGIPDEATRTVAVECLRSASQAMASLFVRPGIGGGVAPISASADNPEAKLDALALEIQKAEGGEAKCSFAKAYDMALSRPDGAALYAEIDAAKRTAQPASN